MIDGTAAGPAKKRTRPLERLTSHMMNQKKPSSNDVAKSLLTRTRSMPPKQSERRSSFSVATTVDTVTDLVQAEKKKHRSKLKTWFYRPLRLLKKKKSVSQRHFSASTSAQSATLLSKTLKQGDHYSQRGSKDSKSGIRVTNDHCLHRLGSSIHDEVSAPPLHEITPPPCDKACAEHLLSKRAPQRRKSSSIQMKNFKSDFSQEGQGKPRTIHSFKKKEVTNLVTLQMTKQWEALFHMTKVLKQWAALFYMIKNVSPRKFFVRVPLERSKSWVSSFRRLDPRFQIMTFFNEVARAGAAKTKDENRCSHDISPLIQDSHHASVFTVWRPTSLIAIRKMMTGEGIGKGLDIKGKSAKTGILSGYIPFMQIYDDKDKKRIRTLPRDGRIRIFYGAEEMRNDASQFLKSVSEEMVSAVSWAQDVLARPEADEDIQEKAMELRLWMMDDPSVKHIDDYARQGCFGIEIAERLFLESYVIRQDCRRPLDSKHFTGRPSEPLLQDMNFSSVRKQQLSNKNDDSKDDKPSPVVWQIPEADHAMCPKTLVVAYEEIWKKDPVTPVVSDFDCFIMGTRGVMYMDPVPQEQLEVMKWSISQIKGILDSPVSENSWTRRWLEVLKESAMKGFVPYVPEFGFSDPMSYLIMKKAIVSLGVSGAVRHGAECFNYYFPQELDDHFLVLSDKQGLDRTMPWKYVNAHELQDILCKKIEEGFTFPLNPKWVLCDPGWKRVYDKILKNKEPNIQQSMACWYPPESGLREIIEEVHDQHPDGFQRNMEGGSSDNDGGALDRDIAEIQLKNYLILQRAKRKLKSILIWRSLLSDVREKKRNQEEITDSKHGRERQKETGDIMSLPDTPAGKVVSLCSGDF